MLRTDSQRASPGRVFWPSFGCWCVECECCLILRGDDCRFTSWFCGKHILRANLSGFSLPVVLRLSDLDEEEARIFAKLDADKDLVERVLSGLPLREVDPNAPMAAPAKKYVPVMDVYCCFSFFVRVYLRVPF